MIPKFEFVPIPLPEHATRELFLPVSKCSSCNDINAMSLVLSRAGKCSSPCCDHYSCNRLVELEQENVMKYFDLHFIIFYFKMFKSYKTIYKTMSFIVYIIISSNYEQHYY